MTMGVFIPFFLHVDPVNGRVSRLSDDQYWQLKAENTSTEPTPSMTLTERDRGEELLLY